MGACTSRLLSVFDMHASQRCGAKASQSRRWCPASAGSSPQSQGCNALVKRYLQLVLVIICAGSSVPILTLLGNCSVMEGSLRLVNLLPASLDRIFVIRVQIGLVPADPLARRRRYSSAGSSRWSHPLQACNAHEQSVARSSASEKAGHVFTRK
eukprot:3900169-Pleurochrysis_carterae.AAC.4